MHQNLVDPDQVFLLVIDYQEAYRKVLHEWERTIDRARVMIAGAACLGIPTLYTEQHPKGLGATARELQELLEGRPRFEKRTLSALGAPGLAEHLQRLDRRCAIVSGIETHACINMTAHDLLDRGFAVHLPGDALSSRRPLEHEAGYAKMLRSGAQGSSVEQILLECLQSADHPAFKAVQQLLK